MAIATLAAGCFWGVEAAFQKVPGVLGTRAGYTGGDKPSPSYQDVCSDLTGHVEAVQIEYDPVQVSYPKILDVFFSIHDPTQKNRQGPDIGSQYRSVIFYHTEEQRNYALKKIEELEQSGTFCSPIMTILLPATEFWPAEEYHQSYYLKIGRRYGNYQ